MAIQKVEIDPNKELKAGDRIELHYKTTGGTWITAAQIALIEKNLEDNEHFRINSHQIPQAGTLIFDVTVLQTTAIIISAMILAAGIIGYLILVKVYQITESPAGKMVAVSSSTGLLLLGIAAVLGAFRRG